MAAADFIGNFLALPLLHRHSTAATYTTHMPRWETSNSEYGAFTKLPGAAGNVVAKKYLLEKFMKGLWDGTAPRLCTEDCMFQVPGAPPMPIAVFCEIAGCAKQAFPDWKGAVLAVVENRDGSATAHTQQLLGQMLGDFPAVGPFPAVALSSVDPLMRLAGPLALPVETGRYTFSADGTKIAGGAYDGTVSHNQPGAVRTTPWIASRYNKRGDMSDVGFGLLFEMMGHPLPSRPPPLDEEAAAAKLQSVSRGHAARKEVKEVRACAAPAG